MSELKFNIGDKIVLLKDLKFLTNTYHYGTALDCLDTVKQANEKRFATSDDFDIWNPYNNVYLVYSQANGANWLHTGNIALHLEKDKDKIVKFINDLLLSKTKEVHLKEDKRIQELIEKKKRIDTEILELRNNGLDIEFGIDKNSKTYKDFLKAREKDIKEYLNL